MGLYDIHGNIISASSGLNSGVCLSEVETSTNGILNLFTDFEYTDGIWVNTGASPPKENANSGYCLSEKIYDVVGKEISVYFEKKNYKFEILCFDANDAFLGKVAANDGGFSTDGQTSTIVPLNGTAYIKINPQTGHKNTGYIVPTISGVTTTYYDFVDENKRKMIPLQKRTEHEAHLEALDHLLWNYTKWKGKKLVVDGNSLVDVAMWGETLADFLGMECTNLGRSGQGLVYGPNNANGEAVYPYVWTAETIVQRVTNDYPEQVDLIMLQGDTNSGSGDGDVTDQMDGDNPKTSWYAKINYLIRCLKAKYPNVIIVMMPDQVRYDGKVKAHELELNHATLNTMRKVAEYNRLAFYDFEHATPYNPLHEGNNWYSLKGQNSNASQDYVHASGTGGQTVYGVMKGKALAGFVSQLIFDPNAPNSAVSNWTSLI